MLEALNPLLQNKHTITHILNILHTPAKRLESTFLSAILCYHLKTKQPLSQERPGGIGYSCALRLTSAGAKAFAKYVA